ncbi:LAQU0S04e00892g1_1 [Lachancea quebecensis]|uniref:Endosomal/vacuolar adapter protein YPT35 n=1 Tax=Lachancea quebecensis TaxID=1654605 RepID=A0A0P1KPQ6_9SACH|nr:LAQU0S04e00892g1_1 [Lachancea quebecensis]
MPQSIQFLAPEPINLVNNEPPADEVTGRSLRFKYITVGSCTIVNSQNNKFSVWQIEVALSPTGTSGTGSPHIQIYKRYTDFELFREKLLRSLTPALRPCIPQLPPKVSWYESWHYSQANFKSSWLARRRAGLEYFLNQVLLNDKVLAEALPCVKEFLEK